MRKRNNKITFFIAVICLLVTLLTSCKKLIEVQPPSTGLTDENVYKSDKTAAAVLTDIYATLSDGNGNIGIATSLSSTSLQIGLSADEITLFNLNNQSLVAYYKNNLISNQNETDNFWNVIYPVIFVCNAAIEGLNNSNALTVEVKQQLLGEAKFMRAFCYFYLVNLYSNVPLVVSTNYKVNALLPRTEKVKVYEQIINDLRDTQVLLNSNYVAADAHTPTTERVRPNKAAATALLARVYLYTNDWAKAEAQATAVINIGTVYDIIALNDVFLKDSRETIWALQPVGENENRNTGEGKLFVLPPAGPDAFQYPVYLSDYMINSFEANDKRQTSWTDTIQVRNDEGVILHIYPYAYKYKVGRVNTPTVEYPVIMRLAEQYLIRAEARAQQGNISGSQSDLNVIRSRAALPNTTASTQASLLDAILHERQTELFTEWGHRWLDLKRRGKIDVVMQAVAQTKGGTWNSFKALYPIPQSDINRNPSLQGHQNPGYQ